MATVAAKRMTDEADPIADPARELAVDRALARQIQQWQADLAQLLVLAPSDADDDQGDQLVAIKEAARAVNSTPQTIWRWQDKHPEALGVRRVGGKIYLSLRKLKFFAHRCRSKF
jgi:hypothetical protein